MIVLKIGGDIFERGLGSSLSVDIKQILQNDKLVIVHGGGDEVTRIAEKLGKEQVFISSPEGIRSRYTDMETAEIYTMVMAGKVNKRIVAFLLKEGILSVGLTGIDAMLLRAFRKKRLVIIDERGRRRIIEGGFTGKISQVNRKLLDVLIMGGFVPVVAPTAIGDDYELLNVDSDRVAAYLAGALGASKVVFLTDVKGVMIEGKCVERLSTSEAQKLLPKTGGGMSKKIIASIEAVKAGSKEAIITSGFGENPITSALNHHVGTVITLE